MRPIEFRGKDIDNGEWVYGYLGEKYMRAGDEWELIGFAIQPPQSPNTAYLVDPDTIGQYIGLKDKNGTKIFEGDIIKIRRDTDFYGKPITFKGVVFFNEDERGFEIGKNGMKGYCISSLASYIFKSSETEIIGNFYDNPEILEKVEG